MTRRLQSIVLLLLGSACADGTSPPSYPPGGVSPAAQWSGGTITAHSAGFTGQALPALYAAGTALSVTRVDDTTLSVRLPVAPSGDLLISRSASGHDSVSVVQIVGLDRSRSVTGMLGFEPLVPECVGGVYFVAQGPGAPQAANLAILDPATDQVTYIDGLEPVEQGFGIQPGFQPNRYVLRDSTGLLGVWRLFPTPLFLDSAGVQTISARHLSQLNDSTWLSTFSNLLQLTTPSGVRNSTAGLINDPLRLAYSPDGTRVAMVLASAIGSRAPVLAAVTGDTAYTYLAQAPAGAAFSHHADALFVSVAVQLGVDSLLAVHASDGVRIGAVPLPAGYKGFALAADAKVDRVYQVAESSGTKALLVYDGATLALLGKLTCPASCGNIYSWSAGIGVDTTTGKIHVAFPSAGAFDTQFPVITYDRLP
jgi:hypothetical protein